MTEDSWSENQVEEVPGIRYLSFSLGNEDYAIPLSSVKEVIAVPEVTSIPFTPKHFLGIMNLRGQVISVMDLREKFGIKPSQSSENAAIICDLGSFCLGVVVDSINSVLSPDSAEISEKPEMQSSISTEYITGIFKHESRLVVLLDIVKALSLEDQRNIQSAQTKKSA